MMAWRYFLKTLKKINIVGLIFADLIISNTPFNNEQKLRSAP